MAKALTYHDINDIPGAGAPGGPTFQPIYDSGEVWIIHEMLEELLVPHFGNSPYEMGLGMTSPFILVTLIEDYSDLWV